MTNLDIWLEKLGLCRLSFYTKMKQGYAQIISMKTKQVQRNEAKLRSQEEEIIKLKNDLERVKFFMVAYHDLCTPPDRYAVDQAWKARNSQGGRTISDLDFARRRG